MCISLHACISARKLCISFWVGVDGGAAAAGGGGVGPGGRCVLACTRVLAHADGVSRSGWGRMGELQLLVVDASDRVDGVYQPL